MVVVITASKGEKIDPKTKPVQTSSTTTPSRTPEVVPLSSYHQRRREESASMVVRVLCLPGYGQNAVTFHRKVKVFYIVLNYHLLIS